MSTHSTSHPVVLIVGGGPVGLTAACELLRNGVSCRLIDKSEARQPWSKAAIVQPRTLELFEDMGIIEPILKHGRPMYGFNAYHGKHRFAHAPIDIQGSAYPYILGLSQRETEEILEAHLQRLGGTLERGVALLDFSQDAEGVRATLQHADETTEQIEVRWLFGCDGAHSTVRKQLALPFEGSTFEQRLIQADLPVKFPFEVDPHEAVAFVSSDGPFGLLPLLSEGKYRLIGMNSPEGLLEPTFDDFLEMAKRRAPEGVELGEPDWMVGFRFHGRIVPTYRVDRVFLAGDAAHIHSPVGGQGMNMGIQDAYNLAWKIAYVFHGCAPESLLAAYNAERRPIGEITVNMTDRLTQNAMRIMTLRSTIAQTLRNQAAKFLLGTGFFQNRVIPTMGGMTVEYPKSPAIGEFQVSGWQVHLGSEHQGEAPNLVDWWSFHQGSRAGQRIPEFVFEDGSAPVPTLHALFDSHDAVGRLGKPHTLLLFDGVADTKEGYENLESIAREVQARYGRWIRIHMVIPKAEKPASLTWDDSILFDPERHLHGHFGSLTECLYLVRPDGYVGFRSQPAQKDALMGYLERWFLPQ